MARRRNVSRISVIMPSCCSPATVGASVKTRYKARPRRTMLWPLEIPLRLLLAKARRQTRSADNRICRLCETGLPDGLTYLTSESAANHRRRPSGCRRLRLQHGRCGGSCEQRLETKFPKAISPATDPLERTINPLQEPVSAALSNSRPTTCSPPLARFRRRDGEEFGISELCPGVLLLSKA